MRFGWAVLTVFASFSVAANASTSTGVNLQAEIAGVYPMANLAQEMMGNYTPATGDKACQMIGMFSSSMFGFADKVTDNADQAGPAAVALAHSITDLTANLSGFCGGTGSVPRGNKAAGLAQVDSIKQKLDAMWRILFPNQN
jgi:hypothetical protein